MSEAEPIEIQFVADPRTRAEAQRALVRLLRLSGGHPVFNFLVEMFVGVACFLVAFAISVAVTRATGLPARPYRWVIVFAVVIALLCLYRVMKVRAATRRLFRLKEFREPVSVTFDAVGVSMRGETWDTRIKWAGIGDVVAMRSGFGLRYGAMLFAVPAHAIPPEMGVQGLMDRIAGWRQAAQ